MTGAKLEVLVSKASRTNKEFAEIMREFANIIEGATGQITGIVLGASFSDGGIATSYHVDNYPQILGAITIVEQRIINEFERI